MIRRIEKIVKKKKQKTLKIVTFLYENYQVDNKEIFYKYGNRWMNFTVRGIYFFKENYRQSLSISLNFKGPLR